MYSSVAGNYCIIKMREGVWAKQLTSTFVSIESKFYLWCVDASSAERKVCAEA
jgi:hypothetical protein